MPIMLYALSTQLGAFDMFLDPNRQAAIDLLLSSLSSQCMRILFGGCAALSSQSCIRLSKLAAIDKSGECSKPADLNQLGHSSQAAFSSFVRPDFVAPGAPPYFYRIRYPLDKFDQILSSLASEPTMCARCKNAYTLETRSAKLTLWKDLPRIFNVVRICFRHPLTA